MSTPSAATSGNRRDSNRLTINSILLFTLAQLGRGEKKDIHEYSEVPVTRRWRDDAWAGIISRRLQKAPVTRSRVASFCTIAYLCVG